MEKTIKQFNSSVYKDRTVHLPDANNTQFDKDGNCEIECTTAQAKYLTTNVKGLVLIEGEEARKTKKDEVVNQDEIGNNQEQMSDAEKAKAEQVDNINAVKGIKALKELASSFPIEEWENFTKSYELKNYLISKL